MSPAERRSVDDALAWLRRMLQPATDTDFERSMLRLRMHCRNAPKVEGPALAVVMADYRRLLADLPADLLSAAVDAYVSRPEPPFWPSVGELRVYAEGWLRERRNMLARAEKLAAGGPAPTVRTPPAGDERKRIAEGFKSAAAILRDMPGPEAQP